MIKKTTPLKDMKKIIEKTMEQNKKTSQEKSVTNTTKSSNSHTDETKQNIQVAVKLVIEFTLPEGESIIGTETIENIKKFFMNKAKNTTVKTQIHKIKNKT